MVSISLWNGRLRKKHGNIPAIKVLCSLLVWFREVSIHIVGGVLLNLNYEFPQILSNRIDLQT